MGASDRRENFGVGVRPLTATTLHDFSDRGIPSKNRFLLVIYYLMAASAAASAAAGTLTTRLLCIASRIPFLEHSNQ